MPSTACGKKKDETQPEQKPNNILFHSSTFHFITFPKELLTLVSVDLFTQFLFLLLKFSNGPVLQEQRTGQSDQ